MAIYIFFEKIFAKTTKLKFSCEKFKKSNYKLTNLQNLYICWLGKLNTKTGELCYVNAGNKNPLIMHDNNFEYLDEKPGLLLARMENMHYEKHVIHLKPNDALFLHTDGITRANDDKNNFYGEKNLKKILNQNKDDDLSVIIKSIENDVTEFCGNHELIDDIAMLIIKIK